MNYLTAILSYIVGMYVPYITSTGVILGLNNKSDRTVKLSIFRTNCLIEGSSIVMAYYGIQSSKSSISIEMDQFADINADLLWTTIITIAVVMAVYLFAIQLYMFIPKGNMYKAIGGGYIMMYIFLYTNLWVTILMLLISLLSIYLLRETPPIVRSLSFILTSVIR